MEGRRNGSWTFFYPDGTVGKMGEYADDKPIGKWLIKRPDGAKLREESYKGGLPDGLWLTYGADGATPVSRIEFAQGRVVSSTSE